MTDIVSPARRSQLMSGIRSTGTKPELAVRKATHRAGLRFRLQRRDLPGSPDLVLPGRRVAVFVHGCFWHRHESCRYAYHPKSNVEFWAKKFQSNVARDVRVKGELEGMGWRVVVIWECETNDPENLSRTVASHLGA